MFSAILTLCLFGDHVFSFSRLHGNDSGGSVGLLFSGLLKIFVIFYFPWCMGMESGTVGKL